MSGEVWARELVERELGRPVEINDTGRERSMYDLRVGPSHAPEIAIECVAAADPKFIETWNIGAAKGPLTLAIAGDWNVVVATDARIKGIGQRLEPVLQEMESRGILNVYVDHTLKWRDRELYDKLQSLKVTHASCFRANGTGQVHLNLPGVGGAVDDHGRAVAGWIGEFLRDDSCQDVLGKLERAGAVDRHAFVIVTFSGAPSDVELYLRGELIHLPDQPPDLPEPVSGVWLVSDGGRRGIRWDGTSWKFFAVGLTEAKVD